MRSGYLARELRLPAHHQPAGHGRRHRRELPIWCSPPPRDPGSPARRAWASSPSPGQAPGHRLASRRFATLAHVDAIGTGGGTLARSGGSVTYSPPTAGAEDSFSYIVTNGAGDFATGTVDVIITEPGAPTLNVVQIVPDGADMVVRFAGVPGVTYQVQYSASPAGPAWQNAAVPVADAAGRFEFRTSRRGRGAFLPGHPQRSLKLMETRQFLFGLGRHVCRAGARRIFTRSGLNLEVPDGDLSGVGSIQTVTSPATALTRHQSRP
jgi:hypothetical protein